MAGLFNGHLLEFPRIRVDSFTSPPPAHQPPWMLPDPYDPSAPLTQAPNAQLYLLTHVHSDHLIGLTNQFTGNIVCSPDTKRMLLRLESEMDRRHHHNGFREVKRRKYEGLCARKGVDYIVTLNPGETKVFDIGEEVSITLLDANHCPGSSMFLVQSGTQVVLHTGDIRADLTFRQTLRRCPQLQMHLPPSSTLTASSVFSASRQLDRIYLDTSAFMGTGDMPEKESVLEALMTQMGLYPADTVFFLNVWCFGWEDVIKEVARHFSQPVHADRYKRTIYGALQSDPFMLGCTTDDPAATRFHACDRYNRCEVARHKGVVQVVMVEVKSAAWELQHQQFLHTLNNAALEVDDWPMTIEAPIARHSPLPELQELVKMFKPAAVSPNTLVPSLQGLDFFVFADLLKTAISSETHNKMIAERDYYFTMSPRFGRTWLTQARAMHSQLSALILAGSQDMMAVLAGRILGPQRDNRDAWGIDQALRIAGWRVEEDEASGRGLVRGAAGTASPITAQAPLPPFKAAQQESLVHNKRSSSRSSPTLPIISTSPTTQVPTPRIPAPSTLGTPDLKATPSTSSSKAGPSPGGSPIPNSRGASLKLDAAIHLNTFTDMCTFTMSDAWPATETPRKTVKSEPTQAIKSEPSHATKSGPSQSKSRHRPRGLKRDRRESNYRLNIAHLSDLAG